MVGLSSTRAFQWYVSRDLILNIWWDTKNWQYILIFEWISVSPDPLMLQKNWSPNDMCHVTSIWIFNEIRKHSIISLSFNNINKLITWLDSARRELSNDMCHVTSFWIFNEIRKNAIYPYFSMNFSISWSVNAAEELITQWYVSRDLNFNI